MITLERDEEMLLAKRIRVACKKENVSEQDRALHPYDLACHVHPTYASSIARREVGDESKAGGEFLINVAKLRTLSGSKSIGGAIKWFCG
jgi:hypothetical protein